MASRLAFLFNRVAGNVVPQFVTYIRPIDIVLRAGGDGGHDLRRICPAAATESRGVEPAQRLPSVDTSDGRPTASTAAALEVHELTKVFGTGRAQVRALDGIDLTATRGEIVLIMGPSAPARRRC